MKPEQFRLSESATIACSSGANGGACVEASIQGALDHNCSAADHAKHALTKSCFLSLKTRYSFLMKNSLKENPIHLGLGATVVAEPEFTGLEWYADYVKRHANDGIEGRLVSVYTFSESWTSWEVHPEGSEAVICLEGTIDVIQEIDGQEKRITLSEMDYAINPPGVWHTADIETKATVLFITAGVGTQHRPR